MLILLLHRTWRPFFHRPATPALYTLSLHDALPICHRAAQLLVQQGRGAPGPAEVAEVVRGKQPCPAHDRDAEEGVEAHCGERSEEHTSELQSHSDLVCRLLLEKKNKKPYRQHDECA